MKKLGRIALFFVPVVFFAGCTTVPGTILDKPTTASPRQPVYPAPTNGSIFQSASYRPLLEDRRARNVGDTLTIMISENTSAGKSSGNSASRTGTANGLSPTVLGAAISTLSASGGGSNSFTEKGATTTSNTFSGTIGVTVVDVLPNGNLVVSGEKQVALDKSVEYVRFSGIINPDDIVSGNQVASTTVADAKFEYRTNTRVDYAEFMSSVARFFYSMSPF